jgi:hypothetical protein
MLRSVATARGQLYYLCAMYLHSSQLLIKLYKDKPSRIGIKYAYEFQALKPYEDLVRKYPEHSFSLKLEPKAKQINLSLRSDQNGEVIRYKDLLYKPDELRKLIDAGPGALPMEFVHIYSEANVLLIARPFKQQTFFTISSYEIIGLNEF